MRVLPTLFVAGTLVAGTKLPLTGPFYLTAVPSNGSDPWPLGVGIASRGVKILSQSLEYSHQFKFDSAGKRLVIAGDEEYASGEITPRVPIAFLYEEPSSPLAQVGGNGSVYLVREDVQDINQWHTIWRPELLPIQVDWAEPGSEEVNAALRIDETIP